MAFSFDRFSRVSLCCGDSKACERVPQNGFVPLFLRESLLDRTVPVSRLIVVCSCHDGLLIIRTWEVFRGGAVSNQQSAISYQPELRGRSGRVRFVALRDLCYRGMEVWLLWRS